MDRIIPLQLQSVTPPSGKFYGIHNIPAVDLAAIEKHVLSVVSEKTGYPPEMLDLELDLEADLGVDTVKQAELFAASGPIMAFPVVKICAFQITTPYPR